MTPVAYGVLDLAALRHNLTRVREYSGGVRVLAVIKANAYGHGLITVAKALDAADALAVARVHEAIELKKEGITQRIVVLEGFSSVEELNVLVEYGFEAVIHNTEQLAWLERCSQVRAITVWLKLDTGMNRLGFRACDFHRAYHHLVNCPVVKPAIVLMTHLAKADLIDDMMTTQQINQFNTSVNGLSGEKSIANSAGILAWKASYADWVRPGCMLFGVSPFLGKDSCAFNLKPVMGFYSRLIAVKSVQQGEAIGYGGQWQCEKATLMGVVAVGYGDGYPRHAPSGTPVLVNKTRVPLIGRVSMDMLTVDLADCPEAVVGDPVTLWGVESLLVEEIAEYANTIPYTLLCGITQRVQFLNNGDSSC
ncbi:MAG TPA: alanine racemase [Methylococcaceae bacterium]|jgi:alanine racemase|nr:alanine racemase [Methylococcaceae bacterium]HIN68456.1 alanine racemase [Methylococcales bacterium]HIA45572.1 alanine racemase [Methylococcaceae bacterium]HIB63447.1 alanine racemase [Methylococcaceae bacterium]HIO12310.1 alanine racemase [Methylococcales bacterium]